MVDGHALLHRAGCGAFVSATLLLVSCSPEVAPEPSDSLSVAVEEVTGAHTRAVWAQHQKPEGSDTYVNSDSHHLLGFDSRDGLGVRQLLPKTANYARPLLSPDGRTVVFSDKNIVRDKRGRKKYSPVVHAVEFGGTEIRELARGYASDIWRDPATGIDWVYAVRRIKTDTAGAMEARELVRFRLGEPEEEELVWDRTPVCPDNIQISRDGARASGQFPWPTGGYLDLENGDWTKLLHGCWTSYAPDDSHLAWVFDGAHRGATIFATGTGRSWKVDLNSAPGAEGHEVYHPRWTNHPRLLTLTGPYKGVEGREIQVTRGGQHAEVYIGRLAADLTGVDAWVKLTDDERGDFYPDVWVAGGEEADLDLAAVPALQDSGAQDETEVAPIHWPAATGGEMVFLWESRAAKNGVAGRQCSIKLHGQARFGRFQELLTHGGWAVPDDESLGALQQMIGGGGVPVVELVVTPRSIPTDPQPILQLRHWVFAVGEGGVLVLDQQAGRRAVLAPAAAGEPAHVAVDLADGSLAWESASALTASSDAVLLGGGAPVALGQLAISHGSTLTPGVVASSRESLLASIAARPPIARIRVRARLAQTTPIPSFETIDPYTRALVACAYEDIEMLEGKLPAGAERIVVQRWGLMDKALVPGMPGRVGDVHELYLEPISGHPELEGERVEDDILDFQAPTFYEVLP